MSPGDRFGSLVVDRRVGSSIYGRTRWLCRCDCGRRITVRVQLLEVGLCRSCWFCSDARTAPWLSATSKARHGTTPKRVVSRGRPHQKPPIY